MSDEEETTVPVFQMNRVFPDLPSPPRDTPSPPGPAHFRKNNPEESCILGSFIHWEQPDTKKDRGKAKEDNMPESHNEDKKDTTTIDRKEKEQTNDAITAHNEEHKDATTVDNVSVTKSNTDTKAEKKEDNGKIWKRKDKGCKKSKDKEGKPDKKSSLFKNVHLSRPATPMTADTDPDKYRIMYLIVRIEQQMEHVRLVLKTMATHKTEKFRITSMVKVNDSLAKLKSQLLGITNNDKATMKQFPTKADLEEFFGAIETICSSVEEVPLEGGAEDLDLSHVVNLVKDGKTRVRKSKVPAANSKAVMNMFKEEENSDKGMDSNNRTPLSREKVSPANVKQRPSRDAVDAADNDVPSTRRRSDRKDSAGRKSGSRRQNQRRTDDDNDVTSERHVDVKRKDGKTSLYVSEKNGDVSSSDSTLGELTSEAKRQLLKNARLQLSKGRSVSGTTEIAESWSESDPDEEDLLAGSGATWPHIHARRHDIRHREHEFNSLMDDIDTLMANTNIQNGKLTIAGMSFEELMSGQRIGDAGNRKRGSEEPRKPRPPLIPGNQGGARSSAAAKKNIANKNRNKPDKFIEEFDQLLNECDNVI